MLRTTLRRPGPLAVCALLLTLSVSATTLAIRAADHADSPDTSEGNLDINDLYVFTRGSNLVFVMTVRPLLAPGSATQEARLNPEGLYQFKLDRERDGIEDAVIQVSALGTGNAQWVDVRGPFRPTVTGTGSNALVAGSSIRARFNESVTSGTRKVFAGPRDDPFFIDLFGDKSVTSVLNAAYSAALGQTVGSPSEQSLSFADPAKDDLAGLNVLAIVVEMPRSEVADALGIGLQDTFFAWATTSIRTQ